MQKENVPEKQESVEVGMESAERGFGMLRSGGRNEHGGKMKRIRVKERMQGRGRLH